MLKILNTNTFPLYFPDTVLIFIFGVCYNCEHLNQGNSMWFFVIQGQSLLLSMSDCGSWKKKNVLALMLRLLIK